MQESLAAFSKIKDPRKTEKVLYCFDKLLFIVLSGAISGCDDFIDIAAFAREKKEWISQFVELPQGKTPSHDTLNDLFKRIDPKLFNAAFMQWAEQLCSGSTDKIINIDGKTVCGSQVHLINAWAASNEICLGQFKTDVKSNEITAIPEFLEMLSIKDAVITIDAIGCQHTIINKIIEKEADYVVAVKQNQRTLYEQIKRVFETQDATDSFKEVEKARGCIETRIYHVIDGKALSFAEVTEQWNKVNSVVKVERTLESINTKEKSIETRYYISSKLADAQTFKQYVRGHWGIENKLHWTLDVIFKEDNTPLMDLFCIENFSLVKKYCINLLNQNELKKSKKVKKLMACLNDNYREELMKITRPV